jgi:hypothetical protein
VSVPYVEIYTISNGKIATNHIYFDQLVLLTQLGLMPAPGS